jgi:protein-S-isoprenylcysteine O-methyltransferase Ste14
VSWRLVPLACFVLFVGVGFVWRTWIQMRRYGGAGIVLFRSGRRAQDLREALFVVLIALVTIEVVLAAVAPDALAALGPVSDETASVLQPLGATLVVLATVLMAVAQLDLGASWRIGIDEGARPGLVTGGLYRFCRNPIFLFMLIALAGFALLLPNWLSFAVLVGGVLGIRRHVQDEESYLTRTYGDEYRAYARRVGRFVPGVGRLA